MLVIFVAGGLIAAGMVLSFYGSSLITQQVTITEGIVGPASPIEIEKQLDPAIADTGVFVVHTIPQDGSISVHLFDPAGVQVATKAIAEERTEEYFEIGMSGTYRLVLENSGTEIQAIVGLSHMPDKSLVALNIFGQAAIISGFVGAGIAVIYAALSRRRRAS